MPSSWLQMSLDYYTIINNTLNKTLYSYSYHSRDWPELSKNLWKDIVTHEETLKSSSFWFSNLHKILLQFYSESDCNEF